MSSVDGVRELLTKARSDPAATLREGAELLASEIDSSDRSVVLRAMSIAARSAASADDAVRYGRLSVAEADNSEDSTVASEARGTLSGSLALAGEIDLAMETLEKAREGATGNLRAQLMFQKGAILGEEGRADEAVAAYTEVLPILVDLGNEEFEALTLQNRGRQRVWAGQLDDGEADLLRSREINRRLGLLTGVAGAEQNLGTLALYRGDIPRALEHFIASDDLFSDLAGGERREHVGHPLALMSAGLYAEAQELAETRARRNQLLASAEHESEAWLAAARAALAGRRYDTALDLARTSSGLFEAQQRGPWLLHSRRIEYLARYEIEGGSESLANDARRTAEALEANGYFVASLEARMLAGRVLLDLGRISEGVAQLESVHGVTSGPVELRVQAALAKALIRRSTGNRRGVDFAVRSGLRLIEDYQTALGASDLRAGIEAWGAELGEMGMGLAIESGRSRRIFGWMERTRARSLVAPPVLPPNDPEVQDSLAELRRIESQLRQPGSESDRSLIRRRRALQESIRDRHRLLRGGGRREAALDAAGVIEALGDRELVEYGVSSGCLWAVHVKRGRFRLHELSSHPDLANELQHLRFQMRRAARTGRRSSSVEQTLVRVGEMVLPASLRIESDSLVVVPTPDLMAIPWSGLPQMKGRQLVVAPSAEVWSRALGRQRRGDKVLVVGGPDLEQASSEVARVAARYQAPSVLDADSAVVDEALAEIGKADVAHVVSHARFEVENPMFSALRLADGDLNVYDIERLGSSPGLVVLSACDSGFTETRAGEELTGLATALLRMGTASVIASVGLVPDTEATGTLMESFHTRLGAGESPGASLASAQMDVWDDPAGLIAAASFICIGSG